jgi:hypothetical protein
MSGEGRIGIMGTIMTLPSVTVTAPDLHAESKKSGIDGHPENENRENPDSPSPLQ